MSALESLRFAVADAESGVLGLAKAAIAEVDALVADLRAKLAGAEQQTAALTRERDEARRGMQAANATLDELWRIVPAKSHVHIAHEVRELKNRLVARNAPVPGLSSLPYYTPADAQLIQASRPDADRSRLLVTAAIADASLRLILLYLTTGRVDRQWVQQISDLAEGKVKP